MTIQLLLYSTSHCHLCEQAQALLARVVHHCEIEFTVVEIAADAALLTLYEVKIPVLKSIDTDVEIDWPFTVDDIYRLIHN